MSKPVPVVDLFSGPGGLAEGFAAPNKKDGRRRFRIALSIEMDQTAHRTLRLRAFLRKFRSGPPDEYYKHLGGSVSEEPDWETLYPEKWEAACDETPCVELGTDAAASLMKKRVRAIRREHGRRTVLLGGPPCQSYSVAGRARNAGNPKYDIDEDGRLSLYREYATELDFRQGAQFLDCRCRQPCPNGSIFRRTADHFPAQRLDFLENPVTHGRADVQGHPNRRILNLQQPGTQLALSLASLRFAHQQHSHRRFGLRIASGVGIDGRGVRLSRIREQQRATQPQEQVPAWEKSECLCRLQRQIPLVALGVPDDRAACSLGAPPRSGRFGQRQLHASGISPGSAIPPAR